MSQLSFYNDLFFPCNEATTSTTSDDVKVSHRYSITANEDVSWGDIYEEYVDFEYTTQSWK